MHLIALTVALLSAAGPTWASCEGRIMSENVYEAPICIPARPQRIVTLDPAFTLGMLLELDVHTVAGAPLMGILDPELGAEAEEAGVATIGNPMQPSLERVAALKPDLIIGSARFHGQLYEKLTNIAPTALIDTETWKQHLKVVAEIAGRAEMAEEVLQAYQERVASIKKRMPDDITVSVVRVAPNRFQVYLDAPGAYAPYAVLQEAGVKRSRYETSSGGTTLKTPDWEEIGELDGDILLYVATGGYDAAGDEKLEAETVANPFWQMLPAVQAGRAYPIDRGTWMSFHGITSANRVLDDIEHFILNAP